MKGETVLTEEDSNQLISFLACLIDNYIIIIIFCIIFTFIVTKLFCEKSNLEIIVDGLKSFNKDQGFILIIIVFTIYAFQEENVWLRGLSILLIIGLSAYLIKQRTDVDKVDKINSALKQEEKNAENDEERSILGDENDDTEN